MQVSKQVFAGTSLFDPLLRSYTADTRELKPVTGEVWASCTYSSLSRRSSTEVKVTEADDIQVLAS